MQHAALIAQVSALEDVVEQQGIPFDDTARATVYARFANALQRLAGASAVNPQVSS